MALVQCSLAVSAWAFMVASVWSDVFPLSTQTLAKDQVSELQWCSFLQIFFTPEFLPFVSEQNQTHTEITFFVEFVIFLKMILGMPSKKRNCPEGDIVTYRREGGEKKPLFLLHQKGDIFIWGEGSKSFCLLSHVHFCASVSIQFVAFLEALHYENFLCLVIK